MSQQLQITGGAKVRDLQDVIIGTSGVLSSLAFNVANGVPKLDVNGKILVSQLPNSVMEYLGTWDASTNTPTLVNGTGNQGDVYLCNVAGTVNFGAGPITFAVGDSAIYSGTIWQKAGGATGTVTSVGLTSTGNDAITITGSPITTSGNINLGFAGTNLQYINGAGDLTTFPTLISSIGLTMPSAFSVANSPLTANGTIAVTGAGYPSQYIRGDGTLADFPTSGGGGSSVSYYLNGGTSQGTIGGVTYYEMSKTADTGTMADFSLTGDGFIVAFLTDAGDPAQLNIPAGNWNYEIYASMSANGGTPQMYAELYVYDGTTFTLISTSTNEILYDGTNLNLYSFGMTVPATILTLTDRLAIKLYATNSGGKTTTIHTQDSHLCQVITTFSTGITALNGLTAQVQYFATGTSGTDFNISSATATHTFNLPVASASNTGKLSSTDWSTFNGKVPYTGATADVNLGTFSITGGIGTFTNGVLNGNGTNPANLYLKKGSSPFFTNAANYGLIAAVSSSFILISDVDGTNYKYASFNLGSLTNNTNRAYTLPDASGTIPLLESTQTFSGTNTFSGLTSFTFSSGTRMDYGPYLTKGSVPSAFSGSTTNIYSDATTNNIVIRDTSSIAKLEFNNSTQTFTFPAASGTIALTSNLSSYVPYTGATTSVNLGAFGLNTTGIFNNAGMTMAHSGFTNSGSGQSAINGIANGLNVNIDALYSYNLLFPTANNNYTFPSATGTIALTSNITSAISGTTNYHAKFTGTNTIGNSLIWDNGTNVGLSTVSPVSTNLVGSMTIVKSYNSDTPVSTTAQTYYTNQSNLYLFGRNAGLSIICPATNEEGSIFFGNSLSVAYASINTGSGTTSVGGDMNFRVGSNTTRMTITSAGNVGIGTSSPSGKLHLSSTSDTYLVMTGGATPLTYSWLVDATNLRLFNGIGDTTLLTIASTGAATFSSNIGLGVTTVSSWGSVFRVLEGGDANNQSAIAFQNSANVLYLTTNSYFDTGWKYKFTDVAGQYLIDGNEHRWYTAASGTAGAALTWVQRMTLTNAGNVGIGTSLPSGIVNGKGLVVYDTDYPRVILQNSTTGTGTGAYSGLFMVGNEVYFGNASTTGGVNFAVNSSSSAMKITSGGNVLVGTNTDTNSGVLVGSQSANNWTIYGKNTASSGSPFVFLSEFTAQAPNNTSSYFYYGGDNAAVRFNVRGNGGIYNYSANNVNLSDASTKKDIIPCESYWDKFKAIEIVKFKYIDQTHDDYNIGVIAQQVESVAPEFIDVDDWATPNGESKIMKAVYTEDLHTATIKVLQEAITKIEEQQAQIQNLQEQINILAK